MVGSRRRCIRGMNAVINYGKFLEFETRTVLYPKVGYEHHHIHYTSHSSANIPTHSYGLD
jgi:hypothetical protein